MMMPVCREGKQSTKKSKDLKKKSKDLSKYTGAADNIRRI